ncbi:MAG: hypothetical protein ACRD4B_04040, partial [Acidobacteriota bacterium]
MQRRVSGYNGQVVRLVLVDEWRGTVKTVAKKRILFSVSLLLLLFMACGQAGKVPFNAGTWVVTDHKAARISAMDRQEADSWVGKVAQYTQEKAVFDGKVCQSPVYERRTIQTEEFYSEFRISPQSLGYEQGPIEAIEVSCGNNAWVTPGSTLLKIGE